jgi:glutamate synthase domain-containing protein 2
MASPLCPSAKYGVRDEQGRLSDEKLIEIAEHKQLKMFEIKMSQGAKPGKGGILPGVTTFTSVIPTTCYCRTV